MTHLFQQAGPVMLAIAAFSTLAWLLIVWKWLNLRQQFRHGIDWPDRALAALQQCDTHNALQLCDRHHNCLARLMREAIRLNPPRRRLFEKHLHPLLASEAVALRRHLPTIATIAGLSPLLGLLGTVLGMLSTFDVMAAGPGPRDPASLADGISQALLTTQAGLIMALPILLLHGYLNARVNRYLDLTRLYLKKIQTLRCHG